jgi:hypothetical protein
LSTGRITLDGGTFDIFVTQESLERFIAALPEPVTSHPEPAAKPRKKTKRKRAVKAVKAPQPATPDPPKHRYPGDAPVIDEGVELVLGGMSDRAAARKLAPKAEGGTIEQREERLRKLIAKAAKTNRN